MEYSTYMMEIHIIVLLLNALCVSLLVGHKVELPYTVCSDQRKCRCLGDVNETLLADCSNHKLDSFPKFKDNVTVILFRQNKIVRFPQNVPIGLRYLDLSKNNIGSQKRENNSKVLKFTKYKTNPHENPAFEKFSSLEYLDLSDNEIDYSKESFIQRDIIGNLTSLRVLNLKLNYRSDNHVQVYPEAISDIQSLEILRIDGVKNAIFSSQFQTMSNLTTLDMSGIPNHGVCKITKLTEDFLSNFPNLVHLNLSGCELRSIEQGSLNRLQYLRELNLSHNEELTFNYLSTIVDEIQTSVEVLDISKIHCTFGVDTMVYMSDVENLNTTNLTHLYIDSNRLAMLENSVMYKLPPSIKYISAKDNRLTMGLYLLQIHGVMGMTEFSGDFTFTSHTPSVMTNRFRSCKDWRAPPSIKVPVTLSHGNIGDENNRSAIKVPVALSHGNIEDGNNRSAIKVPITLSHGNIGEEHQESTMDSLYENECTIKGLQFIVNVPPTLQTIKFSKSGLRYTIPQLYFNKSNNIQYLDFSRNIFKKWKGPLCNLHKLEYLDLNSVYCSSICRNFFQGVRNLRRLIIHSNLLGFEELHNDTFQYLPELRLLNASGNKIMKLPSSIFAKNSKLETLDLSANLLYDWDVRMDNLTNLKYLNLSLNRINYLNLTSRNRIQENPQLKVNLWGNPLECTCDSLLFLEWIQQHRDQFLQFQQYNCSLSNHSTATFTTLQSTITALQVACFSYNSLIIGVVIAILVSMLALVCGLCYRYRWKIRYVYYMTRNKYTRHPNISNAYSSRQRYVYDALVSYAEEDEDLVKNIMSPVLEDQHDFRLCLHQRDFTPGKDIAANITEAIHSSRKIMIILSSNYIRSKWCMYEFNMARMESMYSRGGSNVMVLIFYKSVASKELPLDLLAMIKSKCYIQYPSEESMHIMFCDQIVKALNEQ